MELGFRIFGALFRILKFRSRDSTPKLLQFRIPGAEYSLDSAIRIRNIERSVAQRESMSLLQAFRPVPLSYYLN